MNEEIIRKSTDFHLKLIEWSSKQDFSDIPTIGIINSFFSVAIQGVVFNGSYEEFRKNMIMILDNIITQSIEEDLIQRVDENV